MFQSNYVRKIGPKNFHLYEWWSNSNTYSPRPALVLGNEARETLQRAMPRILTIIQSLPREHIKTYTLIRFRDREFCDGV